jgi:hypothetical protein
MKLSSNATAELKEILAKEFSLVSLPDSEVEEIGLFCLTLVSESLKTKITNKKLLFP